LSFADYSQRFAFGKRQFLERKKSGLYFIEAQKIGPPFSSVKIAVVAKSEFPFDNNASKYWLLRL